MVREEEEFEPGKYLSMLVRSYNPNQYEKLLEGRLHTFFGFLGILLGITALIFSVLVLAFTVRYIGEMPTLLAPVQELRISGEVVADAPVVLIDRPSIVLDATTNGSETTATAHPDILLTSGGIVYPQYIYAGSEFIAWSDVTDLKRESPLRDRLLAGMVLFLAPSLIFWGLAYLLGKVFLISLLLLALGYWVPRAFKHRITFKELLKLLIIALPSVLILGIGLSPLAPGILFWWGVGLSVLMFTIGVTLMSERLSTEWTKRGKERS